MNTTPDPQDASGASSALGQKISSLLPQLIKVAGDDPGLAIHTAKEETCLRPENDAPQTNTRWVGLATTPVKGNERGKAHAALDRLDAHLQADGWEKLNEVTHRQGETRSLYFDNGDLGITAELVGGSTRQSLEIMIDTPCSDHPAEHRMQRSELDPGYGKSSQYYDDGK